MDMRLWIPKVGNTLERCVHIGNRGEGRKAVCYAWIDAPSNWILDSEGTFHILFFL